MTTDDLNEFDPDEARASAVEALQARIEVEERAERSALRAEETREALAAAEETAKRAREAAKAAEQARLEAEEEAERVRIQGEEALRDWRAMIAAEAAQPTRHAQPPEVEAAGRADLQEVLDERLADRTAGPPAAEDRDESRSRKSAGPGKRDQTG